MTKEKLAELLDYLARSLVKHPEAVSIQSEEANNIIRLTLKVAQDDMGRVIGKGGKTAKAIRSLVKTANSDRDKRVFVDIAE